MLWLKWVHILLAIVAVGYNASYGLWLAFGQKTGRDQLLFALRGIMKLDRIANYCYAGLLVTGLGLVHVQGVPFSVTWVVLSLVILVAMSGVTGAIYTPTLRKQVAELEKSGPDSPAYLAIAGRAMRVGIGLTVGAVAVLWLMVFKLAA